MPKVNKKRTDPMNTFRDELTTTDNLTTSESSWDEMHQTKEKQKVDVLKMKQNELQLLDGKYNFDASVTSTPNKIKLESPAGADVATHSRMIEQICHTAADASQKLTLDFNKKITPYILKMNDNSKQLKEQQTRLSKMICKCMKIIKQLHVEQNEDITAIRELHCTYKKKLEELKNEQQQAKDTLHKELNRDLKELRIKLIKDVKQEEKANLFKVLNLI